MDLNTYNIGLLKLFKFCNINLATISLIKRVTWSHLRKQDKNLCHHLEYNLLTVLKRPI